MTHLILHFVQLIAMLVLDVLADELRPLELLARQRAQPLVLGQLLAVGLDERLDFALGLLATQPVGLVVGQPVFGLQEWLQVLFEALAKVVD